MILTAETWAAARGERDRRRLARSSDQTSVDGSPAPAGPDWCPAPATLEDGTPVPGSELAVAMCACEITRVVIDADGAPLDLGRAERVFTGQQRRAVIARDRECGWPECRAHARWCEIHHIRWWERDAGPTSVDNGVLLCSYHHHEVHRRDLVITRVRLPRPEGGPPRPGGTITQVAYEFRDHTGRLIGTVAGARAAGARSNAPPEPPEPWRPTEESRPAAAAVMPLPTSAPGGRHPGDRTDDVELEWATDPVTGARIPACFLVT